MGAGRLAHAVTRPAVAASLALVAVAAVGFWQLAPSPLFQAPQSAVLLARDGRRL